MINIATAGSAPAGELSGNWRLIIEPETNSLTAVTVTVIDTEDYH